MGKWFYLSRDKKSNSIEVWGRKPRRTPGEGEYGIKNSGSLEYFCEGVFQEITGIKVEMGECIRVRLEVHSPRKPASSRK